MTRQQRSFSVVSVYEQSTVTKRMDMKYIFLVFLTSFFVNEGLASSSTCFKCTSVRNNNTDCLDPFKIPREKITVYPNRGVVRVPCPSKKCQKIVGVNATNVPFVIRDCYQGKNKTGSYRRNRIPYNKDFINGQIHICKKDLCNAAPSLEMTMWLVLLCLLPILVRW